MCQPKQGACSILRRDRPIVRAVLSRLGHGLVNQENGDIVAHGINPPALTTLQALAIVFRDQHQRLLAGGADQDVEKVLGNHGCILRQNQNLFTTLWWTGFPQLMFDSSLGQQLHSLGF